MSGVVHEQMNNIHSDTRGSLTVGIEKFYNGHCGQLFPHRPPHALTSFMNRALARFSGAPPGEGGGYRGRQVYKRGL